MNSTVSVASRHPGLAAFGWFLTTAVALVAFPHGGSSAESPALMVNEHAVSPAEIRWFGEQERSRVFEYFKTRHHLEDGKDFWDHAAGGITPRAMLRSNTVARVVREKVEQSLFQKLGLVPEIGYDAFLAQFERTNLEREKAARQGQAVFGPVRYTQLQFYEHWKATLRVQAEAKLAEQRWRPTQSELQTFYEQHRNLFRAPPSFTLEVITVEASGKSTAEAPAAAVQATASNVLAKCTAKSSFREWLTEQPPGGPVSVSPQRFENLNADRLAELFPHDPQLSAVQALASGEALALTDSEAQVRVVRCVGKVDAGQRPYEAVQGQVRARWLARRYDEHLTRLVGEARVRANPEAIEALLL
jgi:hypothetical protein